MATETVGDRNDEVVDRRPDDVFLSVFLDRGSGPGSWIFLQAMVNDLFLLLVGVHL